MGPRISVPQSSTQPQASRNRTSAANLNSLPQELLVEIFSHCHWCDLLIAEMVSVTRYPAVFSRQAEASVPLSWDVHQVCSKWRRLLSSPQAGAKRPWGSIWLDDERLLNVLGGPQGYSSTTAYQYDTALQNIMPLCRYVWWLSQSCNSICPSLPLSMTISCVALQPCLLSCL